MIQIPENCPLFADIAVGDRARLLRCLGAVESVCPKGAVILREGEPTQWLGVVLSGKVLLEHSDVAGNNAVLGSALPGAVFAEPYACLPGEPLMIRAVAAQDSRILFLHAGKALTVCPEACSGHSRLLRNLLTVCARRNLHLSRRILHTAPKTIRGRVLSYLTDEARLNGSRVFALSFNRQQLADYLGVERSALSHELSKMQQDGLIRYRKNRFELTCVSDAE